MSPRATKTEYQTSSSSRLDRQKISGIGILVILSLLVPIYSCSDYDSDYDSEELESSFSPSLDPALLPENRIPSFTPTTFVIKSEKQSSSKVKQNSSTVLKKPTRRGRGSLEVDNGTNRDAYLKLVDSRSSKLVAAFYVKSNSTYTLKRIGDGVYQVLFVSGNDWDSKTRTFKENTSFSKFDRPLNFVTTKQTKGRRIYIRYTIFRLTLHPVVDGDAKTSPIDQQEFGNY